MPEQKTVGTTQKAVRIPDDVLNWLERRKGYRRGVATFVNDILRREMDRDLKKEARKNAGK